jgi:hypothetical protein
MIGRNQGLEKKEGKKSNTAPSTTTYSVLMKAHVQDGVQYF